MYAGERFNSITHIAGSVLAIVGTVVAVGSAVSRGRDGETITAIAIYGAMMIVLYLSSTLYHSLRGRAKNVFHVFDHCAIYLLIAGTYTPITLITLRGRWGWWLFGIVWTLAIAGVLKDTLLRGRYRPVSVVLYVLMGWLVVVAIQPLRMAMPSRGIVWLAAGGLAYTIGIVFFALSKHVVHAHGVWHLCVIGGSACHYVAVTRYVLL
ncbi:MAG TPA: hemolysin III family protein [Thermoanaerobaculia bacterium]|nr:hemolysin III family protein [Thermoanaerobaculia bacterium]